MGLDPRRLLSLAKAARKAGITRLRLPDGTEFELGTAGPPAPAKKEPESPPPVNERWSTDAVRKRFANGA